MFNEYFHLISQFLLRPTNGFNLLVDIHKIVIEILIQINFKICFLWSTLKDKTTLSHQIEKKNTFFV